MFGKKLSKGKIKKTFSLTGFNQSVMRVDEGKESDRVIVSLTKRDKRIPVEISVPDKIEEWKSIAIRHLEGVKIDTEVAGYILVTIPNTQKNRKHF